MFLNSDGLKVSRCLCIFIIMSCFNVLFYVYVVGAAVQERCVGECKRFDSVMRYVSVGNELN